VWRIVVGLSLIPAFGTLYQRLTLAESTRYLESQKVQPDEEALNPKKISSFDKENSKMEKNGAEGTTPPIQKDFVKTKAPFRGAKYIDNHLFSN
jgi:MFS transporter, PHS family, inorganic phosphate transporter